MSSSKDWRRLGWLVLAAGALRAATAWLVADVELQGDEEYYFAVAREMAATGRHYAAHLDAWSQWPPGNAWWLSLFLDPELAITDRSAALAPLLAAQVFVGTSLVAAFAAVAIQLLDFRSAWWATLLVALHPTLIAFSHYLWAANLFLLLCFAGLAAALRARSLGSPAWAVGAGIAFGLGALTRELALAWGIVVALWWVATEVSERRSAALGAVLLIASMLACVAPWTLRNHSVHQTLVPVSTVGWMAMRIGNTLSADDWMRPDRTQLSAFHRRYFELPGELDRMRLARAEALARIRAEQPMWAFKKLVRNSAHLLSLDSAVVTKLRNGRYGPLTAGEGRLWVAVVSGASILLTLFALAGACREPLGERLALLGALAACVFGLHVLANASGRYWLPVVPLLCLWAGRAIAEFPRSVTALRGRRAAVAIGVGVFYLAVAVPYEIGAITGDLFERGVAESSRPGRSR